jgi:anhydro-N-acetylmuramic acid kinase
MSLFIGLMSGTSVDGIDCVLIDFTQNQPSRVIATKTQPWTNDEKAKINALCSPGNNELHLAGEVGVMYAVKASKIIKDLLSSLNKHPFEIEAIASHGQTVRHEPENGFSIQLGNHALLAALTGIDVICDFRAMDIALVGQGAPLVPAFHKEICQLPDRCRYIVNIGGIANVTALIPGKPVIGFDTGPGNTLIDFMAQNLLNRQCDLNGEIAKSGKINEKVLDFYLNTPYFKELPPKSTGRELFNTSFIDKCQIIHTLSVADKLATITELTAKSIIQGINLIGFKGEILVCGGGVHNEYLMERIRANASDAGYPLVASIGVIGIDPDFLEAFAFAWLGYKFKAKEKIELSSITGARISGILGCLYPSPHKK